MRLPKVIIINNYIQLRVIDESVAESLANLIDDEIFRKNIGETLPYPYSIDDALKYIKHTQKGHQENNGEVNYGIYIDNIFAGMIGRDVKNFGRKKHNYHLGYRLGKIYRGKGNMTIIVQGLTKRMFMNIQECHRIYAYAFGRNKGSARVLEKAGFSLDGTLREAIYREGAWYDEWVYGKLRGE